MIRFPWACQPAAQTSLGVRASSARNAPSSRLWVSGAPAPPATGKRRVRAAAAVTASQSLRDDDFMLPPFGRLLTPTFLREASRTGFRELARVEAGLELGRLVLPAGDRAVRSRALRDLARFDE